MPDGRHYNKYLVTDAKALPVATTATKAVTAWGT